MYRTLLLLQQQAIFFLYRKNSCFQESGVLVPFQLLGFYQLKRNGKIYSNNLLLIKGPITVLSLNFQYITFQTLV